MLRRRTPHASHLLVPLTALLAFACSHQTLDDDQEDSNIGSTSSAITYSAMGDALDFLIQDRCDNDPTKDPADPVACPTHRNLQPGEWLYYGRKDYRPAPIPGNFGDSFQQNSFPAPDDPEVVIHTKDGYPFDVWNKETYPEYGGTMPHDGYDMMEVAPPYVSVIETRDACGLSQTAGYWKYQWDPSALKWNYDLVLDNGGILFPSEVPAFNATFQFLNGFPKTHIYWEQAGQARPGGTRDINGIPQCVTYQDQSAGCKAGAWAPCTNQPSAAKWERKNVTYLNNKTLDTIIAHHYHAATGNGAKPNKEVFYFTREYGFTKFEQYAAAPAAPAGPARQAECSGPSSHIDSWAAYADYQRTDCREHTKIEAKPSGWDPRTWPGPTPRFPTKHYEAEPVSSPPPGINQYANPGMHATGGAQGDGWSGVAGYHPANWLLYGPYASVDTAATDYDVKTGTYSNRRVASFTTEVDYVGDATSLGQIQAYNSTTGIMAASSNVARNDFAYNASEPGRAIGASKYRDLTLSFTPQAGAYEFRFWWAGNTWTRIDRVRFGQPRELWPYVMGTLTWGALDTRVAHGAGHQGAPPYNDSWETDPTGTPGMIIYGPYPDYTLLGGPGIWDVMPGRRRVTFTLSSPTTVGGGTPVVTLEAYDSTQATKCAMPAPVGGCIISAYRVQQTISGSAPGIGLPGTNALTQFTLDFNAFGNHKHEFRVYWHGNSQVRVHSISVK